MTVEEENEKINSRDVQREEGEKQRMAHEEKMIEWMKDRMVSEREEDVLNEKR